MSNAYSHPHIELIIELRIYFHSIYQLTGPQHSSLMITDSSICTNMLKLGRSFGSNRQQCNIISNLI